MPPRPLLVFLILAATASVAVPDCIWTKSGERLIGEVTEEGDNLRVKTALVPGGVLVPRGSVVARFPAPDVMLREVDIEIEEVRRLSAGVVPGAEDLPNLVELVNTRLSWCDERIGKLLESYPGEEAGCAKLKTRVAEIRKATAAAWDSICGRANKPGPPRVTPAAEAPGTPIPPTVTDVPAAQVLMSPPAATAPEATAAASRVMQKRLTAFGYRGIEVAVIETPGGSRIKFSSRDGLSHEVRERIRWFGTYRGKSFEGRIESLPAPETMALMDRPLPDRLDAVKNPPGARWFLFNSASVILLQDDPVMGREEFRKPIVDPVDSTISFELTPNTCKAIRDSLPLPHGTHDTNQWALILDGHAFRLRGMRLAYEAEGRVWVKRPPRVTVGPGGSFKSEGQWELRKGEQVWAKTGMVESSWKPIRIALDIPMEIVLTQDE